jgi:PhnB protein
MLGITPYIAHRGNCREAIEFYRQALDAEVLFTQTVGESPMKECGPADNIMHCTLKAGDSTIMMCDDMRPELPPPAQGSISLALGLDDPQRAAQLFARLADGGTTIMPLEKTYWAEAFGIVVDRFGVQWMLNCEAPR